MYILRNYSQNIYMEIVMSKKKWHISFFTRPQTITILD